MITFKYILCGILVTSILVSGLCLLVASAIYFDNTFGKYMGIIPITLILGTLFGISMRIKDKRDEV